METKFTRQLGGKHSAAFLKKRKLLLALPVLAFPFLSMGFWALGGGKGTAAIKDSTGIKLDLPGANLKADEEKDKMSYYDQAGLDSLKLNEQKKNDPYYNYHLMGDSSFNDPDLGKGMSEEEWALTGRQPKSGISGMDYNNASEKKIYQKLDRLNAALTQQSNIASYQDASTNPDYSDKEAEIARLQSMLQQSNPSAEKDPEMEQLKGVLEKLIDAQNPQLVQAKIRQASEKRKGQVFAINAGKKTLTVSTLDKPTERMQVENGNGFYSYDDSKMQLADSQNAVRAVIHQTQSIVTGSTVKLRLADDIYIAGVLIPKETFVYGVASLDGERLSIKINSIRYQNNLFPVELSVYDMDGLDGIYIPGAISREVAKESTDRGLQNIGFSSIDPSIGVQAASVGVEAAKSFLSKKVKLIRVTVKAGYQVLLRDEKQKVNGQ